MRVTKGASSEVKYVCGRFTGPWCRSFDPALAQQPGIPFSIPVRDATLIRWVLLPVLAQLATGCSNPLFDLNSDIDGPKSNLRTGLSWVAVSQTYDIISYSITTRYLPTEHYAADLNNWSIAQLPPPITLPCFFSTSPSCVKKESRRYSAGVR